MQKLREDSKIIPANVTDDDVTEAFERSQARRCRTSRHRSRSSRSSSRRSRRSAAKEVARAKAESILAEIKRGGDFAQLAKRESMDPTTKETGGDLGWARRGAVRAGVRALVVRSLHAAAGELSPVFETPFGFHIVRVDRVQPGEVKAHQILIVRRSIRRISCARTPKRDSVREALEGRHAVRFAGEEVPRLRRPRKRRAFSTPCARDTLPETYQKAFAGKAPNDIITFQIPDPQRRIPKFVVAQLLTANAGGEYAR